MQTFDRHVAANLRTKTNEPGETFTTVRLQPDYSDKDNNSATTRNPFVERLGWIVVGKPFGSSSGIMSPQARVRQLIAYPSTVSTTFGVRDDEATVARVYGSNGQLLLSVPLFEGQATIDATRLPAGIYVVRTDAHHSAKIVKQ